MSLAKHGLAFSVILTLVTPSLVLSAPSPRARIIQESPDGFTLRVVFPEPVFTPREIEEGGTYLSVGIPGLLPGSGAAAGFPELPQEGFPFGLPQEATARIVRVRTLASTTTQGLPPLPVPHRRIVPGDFISGEEERYQPDPQAYQSRSLFPSPLVELGPVMGWRHQRIQTVLVNPVQVVAATGRYTVARELEIEVRFDSGAARGRRVPVPVDAPGWDETMDRSLINPSSSRTFRSRPAPSLHTQVTQAGEVHIRVRIAESGMARIPFADLETAGWPADVPVGEVRLEERGYDKNAPDPFIVTNLPRMIEDTNQNSIFDGGDYLVFYGFNYFDRFKPQIKDSRYSYYHAYWVRQAPGGLDYPVVDGYPAGSYTPAVSFPHAQRNEENLVYRNDPLDSGASIFPIFDTLYWLDDRQTDVDLAFTATNLDTAGTFRVRARWQGRTNIPPNHFLSLDVNGQTILDDSLTVARFEFLFDSEAGPVPLKVADYLNEGTNILTVRAHAGDPQLNFSGILFDWFEIRQDRLFKAVNDELLFNSGGGSGLMEISVEGFSSSDLLLLDITNPSSAFRLTPFIEDVGGAHTLTFRFDAGTATRRFYATVRTRAQGLPPTTHSVPPDLADGVIAPGLPRDLLVDGDGSDYILITHPEFEDAWAPLVAHREALGHRVFVCDVWEVYDQFAGGDKTPWAIQRFLTQAYRNWDPSPSFLLLGGDASEDYRTDTGQADPDWVPTMMHFGNVPGNVGLELAGTDTWYAAFLREGDPETDVLPEMFVGRIPVGTVAETQAIVQKILDYEAMDPTDDWRKRGIIVADDQYSTNILSSAPYCRQASEVSFRNTSQAVCDSILNLGGILDFDCQIYFLADHLDTVVSLGRNPGAGTDCPRDPISGASLLTQTQQYTRISLTPGLRDELSRGHLIWEFTGHANKNLMTHEALFEHRQTLTSRRDVDKINNFGKPFLFMGYACHLAEFEGYREKTQGESIGELLLLAPNRGAIGVMASTGYEWLHTNPIVQMRTSRPLFWDLPRDPTTGRPRRLFGEAMTRGLADLVMEQPTRKDFVGMMRTYQTYGDPALRVDIHTSSFRVEVDGNAWTDGTPLTASSFQDTIRVSAVISDDVDVSSIRVLDGPTELPTSALNLTAPDSSTKGLQTYTLEFQTTLRLGTYDVVIEATDWAGRVARHTMPVVLDARFFTEGKELVPGSDENTVDPQGSVQIQVQSPVPLSQEGFALTLDGIPIDFTAASVGGSLTEWDLDMSPAWDDGVQTLQLRMTDAVGGELAVSVDIEVDQGPLALSDRILFYPNPIEGTEGSLIYYLNRTAKKAEVTIYSVSGRRVRRDQAPGRVGPNAYRWDLRDQSGDLVANGIYLVVLRLEGMGGELFVTDGRKRKDATYEVQRVAVSR